MENTTIILTETSRNFKPHDYTQKGFQDAIPLSETYTYLNSDMTNEIEKNIFQENITFFDFKWFDSSTIPVVNSTNLTNYKVRTVNEHQKKRVSNVLLQVNYLQDRVQHQYTWKIKSIDLALATFGGLSTIVWASLAVVLGNYETFKFENSLISRIYPTSPQDLDNGNDDMQPNERKAKHTMMKTVAERGRYWYGYSEYLCTSFLSSCCCCLCKKSPWYNRRLDRLKRHQEAAHKLVDEIDIVKLLYVQRIGQFIAKLTLNKH